MSRLDPTRRGILWMIAAAFFFAVVVFCVRWLGKTYTPYEMLFYRSLVIVVLMLPWMVKSGRRGLKSERMTLHWLRGLLTFLAVICWFVGIVNMPLGDSVALQFTLPLYTILLAVIFLRERLDLARAIATGVGFVGVLVILRPGFAEIGTPALLVLASAAFFSGAYTIAKSLSRTESTELIVLHLNLLPLPFAFIAALAFGMHMPSWIDIPWLLALGVTNWAAQYMMARSFAEADASIVIPFDFLRLPFTVAFAFIFFSEFPDALTWTGAMIIFAATYYIARRESRLRDASIKAGIKAGDTT